MAAKRRSHVTEPNTLATLPVSTLAPASTQWHRANGRPTRKDEATSQQYRIPQEKALRAESLLCSRHFFLTFLPYNKTAAEGRGTLFLGTCDLGAFGLAAIAIMKRRLVDRGENTLRLEEYYDNGTKRW